MSNEVAKPLATVYAIDHLCKAKPSHAQQTVIAELKELAANNDHMTALLLLANFYEDKELANDIAILKKEQERISHLSCNLQMDRAIALCSLKGKDTFGLCRYL